MKELSMSVVDDILKRWVKDKIALKKAADAERTKIEGNNRQIDSLIAANLVAEKEAARAENLDSLLVVPTDPPAAKEAVSAGPWGIPA